MQQPQHQLTPSILQTLVTAQHHGHFFVIRPGGEASTAGYIQAHLLRNWTRAELERFAIFLHLYCDDIEFGNPRKTNGIFAQMSKYVETRNLNQCRNFTLKMVRKYGSQQKVKEILEKLLSVQQKDKGELLNHIEKPLQPLGETPKIGNKQGFRSVGSIYFAGEIAFECFSQGKEQQLKPTDSEYQIQNNENVCYGKSRRQESHLLIDPNKASNIQSITKGLRFTHNYPSSSWLDSQCAPQHRLKQTGNHEMRTDSHSDRIVAVQKK